MLRIQNVFLLAGALILLAACGGASSGGSAAPLVSATAPTTVPTAVVSPAITSTSPAPAGDSAPTSTTSSSSVATPVPAATSAQNSPIGTPVPGAEAPAATIRLAMQPDSQVSYRVREQLANLKLPSDAVGTTKTVTGTLVIQSDGKVVSDQSKFVVDLSTLSSDSGMRDNFIKRNTLQTDAYPDAVFVPTAAEGLPAPLPASGDVSFKLIGDLTVRGVTKQVSWDVQGKIAGNDLTGTATTALKFEDFGMNPPKTMMALSVEDNIKLEIAFHMTATAS